MSFTTVKRPGALSIGRDSFELLARPAENCVATRINIFRTDLSENHLYLKLRQKVPNFFYQTFIPNLQKHVIYKQKSEHT